MEKRKLLYGIAAISSLFLLTACGNQQASQNKTTNSNQQTSNNLPANDPARKHDMEQDKQMQKENAEANGNPSSKINNSLKKVLNHDRSFMEAINYNQETQYVDVYLTSNIHKDILTAYNDAQKQDEHNNQSSHATSNMNSTDKKAVQESKNINHILGAQVEKIAENSGQDGNALDSSSYKFMNLPEQAQQGINKNMFENN